jgi:hypothetical protein
MSDLIRPQVPSMRADMGDYAGRRRRYVCMECLTSRIPADHLADLLKRTGDAHHAAYKATDGTDPEWAGWYAGHLQALIGDGLGCPITRSEIVYLLCEAQKDQDSSGSTEPWTDYYTTLILGETRPQLLCRLYVGMGGSCSGSGERRSCRSRCNPYQGCTLSGDRDAVVLRYRPKPPYVCAFTPMLHNVDYGRTELRVNATMGRPRPPHRRIDWRSC